MAAPWRFEPALQSPGRKLTKFQAWLLRDDKRFLTAVAARRSGKTVGVRARLIKRCLESPYGTVGYVGPTLKQAKRLQWTNLLRDIQHPNAKPFVRSVNKSELRVEFKNGCELHFFGAEKPESIRGSGFNELVVDEADDPNYNSAFYDEIVYPALSDKLGNLTQIGSPKGRGRLYTEYQKGQPGPDYDDECASIQVTAIEAGIISLEEIERARRTRPARAFAQEYMANFNAPIGLVYDEFDRGIHIVGEDYKLPEFEDVIIGVDWGTANRGSMVVLGIDRIIIPAQDGYDADELARIHVVEEHTHAGMGYDDGGWWRIARDIQKRWQPSTWYCDPAGGLEGYIRQLAQALEGGGHTRVVAADNQVRPGIAAVREFMHADAVLGDPPRLLIHPTKCQTLITEIDTYRYRAHRTVPDEFVDEPVKENDHSCDGLRYGVFSHFYKPYGREAA